jgi:hypothetical protein
VRRVFWLALGLGAGATAVVMTSRWMRRKREAVSPANIGRQVSRGVSDLRRLVAASIDEGRRAMAEREAEIRAEIEQ